MKNIFLDFDHANSSKGIDVASKSFGIDNRVSEDSQASNIVARNFLNLRQNRIENKSF